MCGNAIRCLAKHLIDNELVHGDQLTVGTLETEKTIKILPNGYAVDMGQPRFHPSEIPIKAEGDRALEIRIPLGQHQVKLSAVSMGNPHGVVFVDDISRIPFEEWGPILEAYPIWPAKANIEFVQLIDRTTLLVRVWERGVGPTLACGTGACASAVIAATRGLANRQVTVSLPGGDLEIDWYSDNHVWMTGPAAKVFSGFLTKE